MRPAGCVAAGALCIATLAFWPQGKARAAPNRTGSLLWPLPSPAPILSAFGEYRYDHLHAGIDISTGGATGLRVLAADGGEVYRLKVEWRGYGRALYLRHHNGRVTVYGHLERYEDAVLGLERRVARRQAEAKTRYPGDIYLEPPVPVRRGQVIAYSGESGVGLPHLHFEVRDSEDHPMDPFGSGLAKPDDRLPPVLEGLVVTAGGPGTFIDGSLRERRYSLERRAGIYRAAEPIRANGPILASLEAYDPSGGAGRSGLHSIEAVIDGALAYRLVFGAFRFDQYPEAGLVYDHRHSHLGPPRFAYRLFRLPGNDLASSPPPSPTLDPPENAPGAIRLEPGQHDLRITVADEAGNRCEARLCLIVGDPPPPLVLPREPSDPMGEIRFALKASGSSPGGRSAAPEKRGAGRIPAGGACPAIPPPAIEGEVWDGRRFVPAVCRLDRSTCTPPDRAAGGAAMAARLRHIQNGIPSAWSLVTSAASGPSPLSEGSLTLLAEPSFLDVLLALERPSDPEIVLRDGLTGRPVGQFVYRDGLVVAATVAYPSLAEISRLDVGPTPDATPALRPLAVDNRFLLPGKTATLSVSGARIELQAGSRFFPGPMLARSAGLPEVSELPTMAQAIDLLPEGEALDAPAVLSFDAASVPEPDLSRLGIYRWDSVTSRWNFEGGDLDPEGRTVSLKFRRYGRFVLLKDPTPPVVSEILPPDGSTVDRHASLSARVTDVGMGLNDDGVSFVLDGAPLEVDYDPDRDRARPFEPPSLARGIHHLLVVATDRAGNVSKPASVSFEVR